MYDRSTMLWQLLQNVLNLLPRSKNTRGRDHRKSLFWVANQRFYRQMLLAAKARRPHSQPVSPPVLHIMPVAVHVHGRHWWSRLSGSTAAQFVAPPLNP